jgi:hypothetical protein
MQLIEYGTVTYPQYLLLNILNFVSTVTTTLLDVTNGPGHAVLWMCVWKLVPHKLGLHRYHATTDALTLWTGALTEASSNHFAVSAMVSSIGRSCIPRPSIEAGSTYMSQDKNPSLGMEAAITNVFNALHSQHPGLWATHRDYSRWLQLRTDILYTPYLYSVCRKCTLQLCLVQMHA